MLETLYGIAELPTAKGDKANLTKAERNKLADLTDALVRIWKERTTP